MSERIYTRCPACGNTTLVINEDKHLLCTWINCPDPTKIDRTQPNTREDVKSCQTPAQKMADRFCKDLSDYDKTREDVKSCPEITKSPTNRVEIIPGSNPADTKSDPSCGGTPTPRTDAAIEEFEYATMMFGGEIGGGSREIVDPDFARILETELWIIAAIVANLSPEELATPMAVVYAVERYAAERARTETELSSGTAERDRLLKLIH